MKKFIAAVLAVTLILCCAAFGGCQKNQTETFELPQEYKLSFSEEFENGYDESIWSASAFTPRKGGYWSDEQVFTENGNLIIRTEYKENGADSGYYTGELSWTEKRSTYGYYEIRCKVDNVRGAWSAFWLMPDNISNMAQKAQDGCEIDIFLNPLCPIRYKTPCIMTVINAVISKLPNWRICTTVIIPMHWIGKKTA